jgi:ubiquinone/menaquinone biosynthesis C-methylase UbiE
MPRMHASGPKDSSPGGQVQGIIDLWKTRESPDYAYFASAEDDSWTKHFWSDESTFRERFDRLDLTNVLELACGTGRHTAQFVERAGTAYLADTSVDALDEAKQRFANANNVVVLPPGDGMHIPLDADGSLTAIFSYDAMVHFELECIASYVAESARLLAPGGMALLHHSAYEENPGGTIADNPGWRNFMPQVLFNHFALRNGFEIVDQFTVDWSAPGSDCLSLLRKPA